MRYKLAWAQGPSAVIDVQDKGDALAVRYEGPFRLTLRPLLEVPGTPDDLAEPVRQIREIAGRTGVAANRGGAAGMSDDQLLDSLADSGDSLMRSLVPRFVAGELAGRSIFLEVGTDEKQLPTPFELMRDDADYVCLRHAMGRYVNLGDNSQTIQPQDAEGDLSVLLICVPKPQPIGEVSYENLPEASAEFEVVSKLLIERGIDVVPLHSSDARKQEVMKALHGGNKFTIIHFTGHGHLDEVNPGRSGLALFDGILTVGEIAAHLDNAPALAFINGCETAVGATSSAPGELTVSQLTRVFGTARPFLKGGSYVLGTRWRVSDAASSVFATTFYDSLLTGESVGESVRKARNAVYDPDSTDLSWASYVYYGDPRLIIRAESAEPGSSETIPTVQAATPSELPPELEELSDQYEEISASADSSWERTLTLESLVKQIRESASGLPPEQVRAALGSSNAGNRLVGVTAARDVWNADIADALGKVLADPASTFEEYHALVTFLDKVEYLDEPQRNNVRGVLEPKLDDEDFLVSDRAMVGRELLRKIAK